MPQNKSTKIFPNVECISYPGTHKSVAYWIFIVMPSILTFIQHNNQHRVETFEFMINPDHKYERSFETVDSTEIFI